MLQLADAAAVLDARYDALEAGAGDRGDGWLWAQVIDQLPTFQPVHPVQPEAGVRA